MKQKHFIDSHKAITAAVVFLMIARYDRWENVTAWLYLALHGTYGLLWFLKSRVFPDRSWEQAAGWSYGLLIWGALTLYWMTPWLITSRDVSAPAWYIALCVSLYTFGVFFHFTSDMQKYVALQVRPGSLITDGMMARSRNMNYFGELLIYLGFGLLAMHWLPLVVLALFVMFVWAPNMIRKDRSLSRYPGYAAYRERSKWLIPFIL